MKEIKEMWQFYKKLKECSYAMIDNAAALQQIHIQDDVKLQVTFTFEKDGEITMFVDALEIENEEEE